MDKLAEEIERIENKEIDAIKILDGLDSLEIDKEGIELITKAIRYCFIKHAGQKRTEGTHYSAHPTTVARIVIDAIQNDEELNLTDKEKVTVICSALLHDVLEDTETTYEELKNEFNEEIAECVEKVTKPKDKSEGYKEKYFEKAFSDKLSALVKLADRIHNVRTEDSIEPGKVRKKAAETFKYIIRMPLDLRKNCSNYLFKKLEHEMEHTDKNYFVKGPIRLRTGEHYKMQREYNSDKEIEID